MLSERTLIFIIFCHFAQKRTFCYRTFCHQMFHRRTFCHWTSCHRTFGHWTFCHLYTKVDVLSPFLAGLCRFPELILLLGEEMSGDEMSGDKMSGDEMSRSRLVCYFARLTLHSCRSQFTNFN